MNVFEQGQVLLVDKPLQWTSFDVVREVKKMTAVKKVGHAGTLDPLASGLLIVCTGKFTKRIGEFMAQEKEYTGSLTLGATTPTFDLESIPCNFKDYSFATPESIARTARKFLGETFQVPPVHSAIKKNGRPVYSLARKGIAVELASRKIVIREFEIMRIALPQVAFRVVCSTGVYIRSLANDFGFELGCGAYLDSLCRTRIGPYKLEDALSMDKLHDRIKP